MVAHPLEWVNITYMPKSLKDARKEGKLKTFVREHENDAPGDLDKLEKAIRKPSQGSASKARKASPAASSDD